MSGFATRLKAWRARLGRAALCAEAEALLRGTYLEYALRGREQAAAWMALNAAAHADLAHLQRTATRARPIAGLESEVAAASRLIASEVLAAVGEDVEMLGALQRTLLAPLELDMLALGDPAQVTVGTVVAAARAVLGVGRL